MHKIFDSMVLFIAQGAFSGRLPIAPGTAGTVVGVLLYLLLQHLSPLWYGAACAGVAVLGTWAAGYADRILGTKDSPSIVIDEIAGFLAAMLLIPFLWGYVVAGVILFRFFDIAKPGPVGWADRRFKNARGWRQGVGIMLDDLVAALCALLVIALWRFLWP